MRRRVDPGLLILLTPLLWGATFPASKLALEHLPPLTFMAWTRVLGFATILATARVLRIAGDVPARRPREAVGPSLLLGGLIFAGYVLQTEGLARTTATNAGFITSLYVVLTPILAAVVLRRRASKGVWWSVLVSMAGVALLSVRDLSAVQLRVGDALVLAGDLAWAGHILALEHFAPRFPPWLLSLGQMAATALLQTVAAVGPGLRIAAALSGHVWPLLVVTGVLGTGIAFTLQVVGQRSLSATRAVVLLAGEALFAAAFSAIWIGERLSAHQWLGGILVLAAMAYSEVSARRRPEVIEPAAP